MDQQGFLPLSSYPSKSENTTERISSPESRVKSYTSNQSSQQLHAHNNSMVHTLPISRNYSPLSSFPQDPYPDESAPSIITNSPRYPESAQRTLPQYHDHIVSNHGYLSTTPAYFNDQGHPGRSRYTSAEEGVAGSSNFYAPLSSSGSMTYHLPPMNSYLPPTSADNHDYRSSLRDYHDVNLSGLHNRRPSFQPAPLNDIRQNENTSLYDSRFYSSVQGTSRSNSGPSDRLLHSPSHSHSSTQDFHDHQRPQTHPSVSSARYSASYPNSAGGSQSRLETNKRTLSSISSHVLPSSIPMSNPSQIYSSTHENEDRHDRHSTSKRSLRYEQTGTQPQNQDSSHAAPPSRPSSLPYDPAYANRGRSSPHVLHIPSGPYPPSTISSNTSSPLQISDNEVAGDSDSAAYEDEEYERYQHGAAGPSKARSSSAENRGTKRGLDGRGGMVVSSYGPPEIGAGPPIKKKKKSKMHDCTICGKKFPRPSGLKTHMNTHNNEKPFACGYPGCTRTFGVRSNARRHMRTHGVYSTAGNPNEPKAYVVDFEPPMILPPPNHGPPFPSAGMADNARLSAELHDENLEGEDDHNSQGYDHDMNQAPARSKSSRAFKVRWMPLSLNSKADASLQPEAEGVYSPEIPNTYEAGASSWPPGGSWQGISVEDDQDEDEDRQAHGLHRMDIGAGSRDIGRGPRMDYVRGPHGDIASASRLSMPFPPVYAPSSTSHGPLELTSTLGLPILAGTGGCRCTPRCPSDAPRYARCRSASSSLGRDSSGADFFSASNSDSASPPSISGSDHRRLSLPKLEAGIGTEYEGRYSYLDGGTYAYQSSQRGHEGLR